jgi:hypothetical protein
MWQVIMFIRRLPSVTASGLRSGWLDRLPEALTRYLEAAARLNRVTFSPPAEGRLVDWSSGYDGVLELRFDDFDAAALALTLLQGAGEFRTLAARALDLVASRAWLGEARSVLEKPGVGARLIVGAHVAEGWKDGEEAAQRYWRDTHPVVARADSRFWGRLLRYTQIRGVRTPGAVSHMPISAVIGAASFEELNTAFATEHYQTIVRPDELKFVSPAGMLVAASSQEDVLYERP